MPQKSFTILENKVTLYNRGGGSIWHARIKLKTGEWWRFSTKHAERNRLIVMLSYLAGLRACEIAALTMGDVIYKIDGKWEVKAEVLLTSRQTKGKKAQTVILSSALRKEITNYYSKYKLLLDRADCLIASQKGTGFSSQTIQNLFRGLYEAAGVVNASSHSGRRTFITNLSEKGVSVRVIQ